jgi:hypothetical protein
MQFMATRTRKEDASRPLDTLSQHAEWHDLHAGIRQSSSNTDDHEEMGTEQCEDLKKVPNLERKTLAFTNTILHSIAVNISPKSYTRRGHNKSVQEKRGRTNTKQALLFLFLSRFSEP